MTAADKIAEAHNWPERLMLRDTGLHDDLGGPGQRIYTTAGRGYERVAYVRSDLADALLMENAKLRAALIRIVETPPATKPAPAWVHGIARAALGETP